MLYMLIICYMMLGVVLSKIVEGYDIYYGLCLCNICFSLMAGNLIATAYFNASFVCLKETGQSDLHRQV